MPLGTRGETSRAKPMINSFLDNGNQARFLKSYNHWQSSFSLGTKSLPLVLDSEERISYAACKIRMLL